MAESGFLVTLPSNSNMSTNPDNEPANFTVKLAEPLNLNGDWEAALVSVQYTPSWITFAEPLIFLIAYDKREVFDDPRVNNSLYEEVRKQWHEILRDYRNTLSEKQITANTSRNLGLTVKEVIVYPKYYESPEAYGNDICKAINEATSSDGVSVTYVFDQFKKRGRFMIKNATMDIVVLSKPEGIEILGHETTWLNCGLCKPGTSIESNIVSAAGAIIPHPSSHYYSFRLKAKHSPKLGKVNSLWVYNNITQYQQVGDTKAPLLGIIPTFNDNGRRVHYTVNPVHYLALNHSHIPEIRIKITDDKGKRVPFAIGENTDNLVCCLRFRRRKAVLPI